MKISSSTLVNIILVGILLTSMFIVGMTTSQFEHNVWDIQNKLEQTRWIRFYNPNETSAEYKLWSNNSTFVWTPKNSSNNAILSWIIYFEHHMEPYGEFHYRLVTNNFIGHIIEVSSQPLSRWTRVYSYHQDLYWASGGYPPPHVCLDEFPNQESYTITFQFYSQTNGTTAFVRNINILIEVMDGMPSS